MIKKDWKDFEHEVEMKLKGYSDKKCFTVIPKPILKHPLDKADYRLPEFILISDENKSIFFLDCKKNYWQNIDMGSLNRLGWAIRAFLDKKGEYNLPDSSKIHFSHKRPQELPINEYVFIPVLLCTGAEFDYKKYLMYLPDTNTDIEYVILNFKYFDEFVKFHFKVPSYSSSVEITKERIKQGELPIEEYNQLLNTLVEAGHDHYLTELDIKEHLVKGSDTELVLRYLYAGSSVSPIELERFGKSKFKDKEGVGVMVESFKYDLKVYLPLGTEKTSNIVLKLLNKKLIEVRGDSSMVWVLDGGLIYQPSGTRFGNKNLEGTVVAFVFIVTEKGKKILEELYGGQRAVFEKCYQDMAF